MSSSTRNSPRFLRPRDLSESPVPGISVDTITRLHVDRPTMELEDARPLERPVGRHRKREVPNPNALPGERNTGFLSRVPVGPLPVGEGPTQQIVVPLPSRKPGVALAVVEAEARKSGMQAAILRALHGLRAACTRRWSR